MEERLKELEKRVREMENTVHSHEAKCSRADKMEVRIRELEDFRSGHLATCGAHREAQQEWNPKIERQLSTLTKSLDSTRLSLAKFMGAMGVTSIATAVLSKLVSLI